MRQSRLSNSSLKTDRKTLKRDESFQKPNYFELSNSSNLLRRSISKEVKYDISKDISQKILFPTNNGINSDKKSSIGDNKVRKIDNKQIKNTQYFFECIQD
jgi:hypothetical protein